MEVIQKIFWFVIALGILVTFHEFGHFYVARRCGVRVLKFSVGFGKSLLSFRDKHGTEFCLAPIPLGGYVKMLDEREGEVAEEDLPYAFNRQSVWKRMAIVVAGPVANFILAVLFFWAVLIPGEAGIVPIIDTVKLDSIAERAGLEPGQEIVAVDGEETPTWQDLRLQLFNRIGETGAITFTVQYPDSDKRYVSDVEIEDWMKGAEEPEPVEGLGLELQIPPVTLGEVEAGGPGDLGGLQEGDLVHSAGGEDIKYWRDFVKYVSGHADETFDLIVERDGQELSLPVTPKLSENGAGEMVGMLRVGLSETHVRRYQYSVTEAFGKAAQRTWDTSGMVLLSFKKLITGQLSPKNLSGPITIATVAGSSAQAGWVSFAQFLGFLSVMLGVLNLLPIPVLDGGHLLYFVIEAIKGSPISERVQMVGFQVGMFLLVGVMVFALYNDFGRLY